MKIVSPVWALVVCMSFLSVGSSQATADDPPEHAQITAVGELGSSTLTSLSLGGNIVKGKAVETKVFACVLKLDAKTCVVAIVDLKNFPGNTKEEKRKNALACMFARSYPFAITGRLVPESKEVNTGGVKFGDAGIQVLKDKKNLILVGDSITQLNPTVMRTKKDRFPPKGKILVQGKQVCGKENLKLFDEPTLAVQNGSLPIVLDGDKSKAKAGKASIRVVGSLKVDDKGLVRLIADEVKEIGK